MSGNVCPELPGEAELLPRASGKASSRPQPTSGDIQGDAIRAGALHVFPVPLASPEGVEKDPAAALCVHHCQSVPIPVGQVAGTKQGRSGDRQTDFGPGVGQEGIDAIIAELEVAEELWEGRVQVQDGAGM